MTQQPIRFNNNRRTTAPYEQFRIRLALIVAGAGPIYWLVCQRVAKNLLGAASIDLYVALYSCLLLAVGLATAPYLARLPIFLLAASAAFTGQIIAVVATIAATLALPDGSYRHHGAISNFGAWEWFLSQNVGAILLGGPLVSTAVAAIHRLIPARSRYHG